MRRSAFLAATIGGIAVPPLSAIGASGSPIRIGYDPIDSSANLLSAVQEGFFQQAAVPVDLEITKNGSAGAAALVAGALDVTQVNLASLIAARLKQIPFSIIALGTVYTNRSGHALVVAKDSPAGNAGALNGKTVAVNAIGSGLDWFATHAAVDKAGGDSRQIRFVEMPFSLMPDALSAGRVDAALLDELYLSVAQKRGDRIIAFAYDAISPTFLVSASIATTNWIQSNVDLARRFNAVMQHAAAWANQHRDETAAIVAKAAGVDIGTITSSTRAIFAEGQQSPSVLVQPVIDAVARYAAAPVAFSAPDLFSKEVYGPR